MNTEGRALYIKRLIGMYWIRDEEREPRTERRKRFHSIADAPDSIDYGQSEYSLEADYNRQYILDDFDERQRAICPKLKT